MKRVFSFVICLLMGLCSLCPSMAFAAEQNSVTLYPSMISLDLHSSYKLTAVVSTADGVSKDLVWTSSYEPDITVDDDGTVHTSIPGSAVIRAALKDDPDTYAECTVVCIPSEDRTYVILAPNVLTVEAGQTAQITPYFHVQGQEEDPDQIEWVTSSWNVGYVEDGVFHAVGVGEVQIGCRLKDNHSYWATCEVTVVAPAGDNVGKNTKTMYRLYNPNSGEHFYTADLNERSHLKSLGWKDEGVAWYAPVSSSVPVYRLYNPVAGDHHYTTSDFERKFLMFAGWNDEGIGWYSLETSSAIVYRLYNPNATGAGAHHYTLDVNEYNTLSKLGWKQEGIGWYGANYQ